jgi:predicted MFS family arabinose efflux permease
VGRADDKVRFKLIFIVGLVISGICGVIAFLPLPIYTVLAILVFASCGLAILEPTRESYFFWLIRRPKQQARLYGPYKTGYYVGNVAGKIIPGAILIFLPFNFVFLSMGLVMLLLCFVAFRVKY